MSFYSGECPATQSDYVAKGFFSVLLQSIPFIGSSVDSLVPGPPTAQNKLSDLQNNVQAQVDAWQKEITETTLKNVQELNDLITTILGDPDNGVPDYASAISMYYLEPVKEQDIINTCNIAFLGVMLSLVVWYLLSIKKS